MNMLCNYEWTDDEGTRAVIYDGRLSVYGKPSMTRGDGVVAIGVDLPAGMTQAMSTPTNCEEIQTLARATASENRRLRQALDYIKQSLGAVCPDYAMCDHLGCRDSRAAWEVADRALDDPEMPWNPAWNRPSKEAF